jgi:hypothetical protein
LLKEEVFHVRPSDCCLILINHGASEAATALDKAPPLGLSYHPLADIKGVAREATFDVQLGD